MEIQDLITLKQYLNTPTGKKLIDYLQDETSQLANGNINPEQFKGMFMTIQKLKELKEFKAERT